MKIITKPGARMSGRPLAAYTVLDTEAGEISRELADRWIAMGIAERYRQPAQRERKHSGETASKSPGSTREKKDGQTPEPEQGPGQTRA